MAAGRGRTRGHARARMFGRAYSAAMGLDRKTAYLFPSAAAAQPNRTRGSSRGPEQNTNISLTAYAGRGTIIYTGDGAGGDDAPAGRSSFQRFCPFVPPQPGASRFGVTATVGDVQGRRRER